MTTWLDLVAGGVFVLTAAAALGRSWRAALLAALAAAAWFAGDFAVQASLLHRPLMLHAALAFPAVRLSSRPAVLAVGLAWLGALVLPVGQQAWVTLGLAVITGFAIWTDDAGGDRVVRRARAGASITLTTAFALVATMQAFGEGWVGELDPVPAYYALIAWTGALLTYGFLHARGRATESIIELSEVDPDSALEALRREASSAGAAKRRSLSGAIELLQLNIDLRRRLAENADEVRASRLRLVEAGLAERQRLGTLLAVGAHAHLDELADVLGALSQAPGPGHDLAERSRAEVVAAKSDIEQVARGLHPGLLVDAGLAGAITDLADRCPFPVTVSAPDGRFDPLVESTLWYVCAEALANAVKYADASRGSVEAVPELDGLALRVRDDGVGGAKVEPGGGLAGLADRVAAVGGRLSVRTLGSGGVEVAAWVPC